MRFDCSESHMLLVSMVRIRSHMKEMWKANEWLVWFSFAQFDCNHVMQELEVGVSCC